VFTVVVANPKGGAGKTTVATNLAGYLAGKHQRVMILDMDRQRSATRWLARRPRGFPEVRGALPDAEGSAIRDYRPQWLIIDAPAALHGAALAELVRRADAVLVPVSTSTFDFEATADFLAELATLKPVKEGRRALAIVGSRVDGRTVAAADLDAFLAPLALDVLAAEWPLARAFDAMFCANMIHISPWATCGALMRGAARHLGTSGLLILYGPFLVAGIETAPGNLAFDADLRARDPQWGLRRSVDVDAEAARAGLHRVQRHAMPANNLTLVYRRDPG